MSATSAIPGGRPDRRGQVRAARPHGFAVPPLPTQPVFAFDFGGSIRAAALAMGGDWHDLGGGLTEGSDVSVSLQPLARIHDTYERARAADWIVAILSREGITITPEAKEHIWTALTSLASAPIEERTITGLNVLLQSNDLKQALRPYCVGGPYGRPLDAETEHLGSADVQAFEIEGLVGTGAAPAVLAYLFHRIGDRLDGRPTLLIIDEGWLALDDEGFAGQLREWLKTLRKKNASVIFATQSLSDIDNSDIAPAIIESCPTRLLLPNERAIEPQITAIYRRFGLNDRQIEILARATPSGLLLPVAPRNRLFELGLSELGLALCAASSKSDQTLIANLVAEHGRDGFLPAWLDARDVGWAIDLLPGFQTLTPSPKRSFSHDRPSSSQILRGPRSVHAGGYAARDVAVCDVAGLCRRIVYDPTNYAQNVLTAARTLEQINHQITSLQNEATMLINRRAISRICRSPRSRRFSRMFRRPSSS